MEQPKSTRGVECLDMIAFLKDQDCTQEEINAAVRTFWGVSSPIGYLRERDRRSGHSG